MSLIGNRYLQGEPTLPYPLVQAYPNNDVFMDLAFLDHTGTPVVPTSISIEIDDISNSIVMLGPQALTAGGATSGNLIYPAFASTMYLQIAGAVLQMDFPNTGSQKVQVGASFTAIDSVTGQSFTGNTILAIIELCQLATVSGQLS